MTAQSFYRRVMDIGGVDAATAKRATAAVFHALRDRLTQREADQVFAQLPWELQLVWVAGEKEGRRPLRMNREQFYAKVKAAAGLESRREARTATLAVFAALERQISPGEAEDVHAQLPRDLKEVWEDAGREHVPDDGIRPEEVDDDASEAIDHARDPHAQAHPPWS